MPDLHRVAHGIDVRGGGLHPIVDLDIAALRLYSGFLKSQSFDIGLTANAEQYLFCLHCPLAVRALDMNSAASAAAFHGDDLTLREYLHALGLKLAANHRGKLRIHERQELGAHLNYCDLAAKTRVHAAKLKADHSAADNEQALRNMVELQAGRRIDDRAAFADPLYRRDDRRAAGGDDYLSGSQYPAAD